MDWMTMLDDSLDLPLLKRVEVLERLIERFDQSQEEEGAFYARLELVESATNLKIERVLVAFAWCTEMSRKDPERFMPDDLVDPYSWVIGSCMYTPSVSRAVIEELFESFGQSLNWLGSNGRPLERLRAQMYTRMDLVPLPEIYTKWKSLGPDVYGFPQEAAFDTELIVLEALERDEDAYQVGRHMLDEQMELPPAVPHNTLANLLRPCVRLGKEEEALRYHKMGYKIVRGDVENIENLGTHLLYAASRLPVKDALAIFERNVALRFQSNCPGYYFDFLSGARCLFKKLGAEHSELHIRLPETCPVFRADGRYVVRDLESHFEIEERTLAEAFDARNGNDLFARKVARAETFV